MSDPGHRALLFFESGYVAYQIKGNEAKRTTTCKQIFFPYTRVPGQNIFLKVVMLHIKGNETWNKLQAKVLILHTS